MQGKIIGALLTSCLIAGTAYGQSVPTSSSVTHTLMIHTIYGSGTVFSIDVDQREYWITAKHMFTGVKSGPAGTYKGKTAEAEILSPMLDSTKPQDERWVKEDFRIIDPGKDIDILVLVPAKSLASGGISVTTTSSSLLIGGDCEFLGFPYGLGWNANLNEEGNFWLPFVKHCTISGQIRLAAGTEWVLDGMNNHGFSGGPVIEGNGENQKVFAVVSGFHTEPLEVCRANEQNCISASTAPPNPPPLKGETKGPQREEIVEANSGIVLAFAIEPAIEAIRRNAIGPLISTK